ncbi:hypothetical protein RSOLAG1IB_08567 [Rhizoctonia solani AG-1 IB]|jgi:hypothetical protein|uniref:Uncharacterized protein n=1 Tax=Thanatephorus cucumeris (strain AG1-IB / isolate 7/3/14) TaxID=1108050 RepID=A0A0B7FQQ2_THACB|nr:hypothetical protein RSOLAG1IB_08567 [Rhizoctonia solani AG-1 IB]
MMTSARASSTADAVALVGSQGPEAQLLHDENTAPASPHVIPLLIPAPPPSLQTTPLLGSLFGLQRFQQDDDIDG